MSMKIYNSRLNTILTSGRASELVLVILSLHSLPQMACPIWPSIEGMDSNDKKRVQYNVNECTVTMIYIWSNIIQTCSHASVLVLVIVSPNRLPQMTASFGRLSKEWTPTLCDVMNVHCGVSMATIPTQIGERWRQLQHIQFWLTQSVWQKTLELIEIKLQ